ncbi:MAG TPA: hypothetical protein PK417_11160 [Hyphomonas sp.]|nr:hypothetical protein [Hyphomonas sp.]HRX75518.1 hypothetical protein [Hyphomonas sp.]
MRTACLTALALASTSLPALAETPLDKARAAPKDGPAYTFDLSIDDGTLKAKAKVDPSRPEGERLTLVTPDATTLEGDAAEKYEEMRKATTGENIWCSNFASNIPDDARLISESGEAAVYSFQPIPEDKKDEMAKVYKFLTGRVTVSKETPSILAFELFAEKAFKPAIVARVDSFSMKATCDYAPDGRTYIRDFAMDVSGNAMMQPFTQSETRVVSNLVALPGTDTAAGQR